ncbi:MAG TPA: TIGR01777 family oxidoreductase, partial [Chitinophagales bacterium]|nr:TIGR01777 family oxidoreductase [Chitinophagales bacterium]
IAGGTGLVGKALQKLLRKEAYEVNLLSRKPSNPHQGVFNWDPAKGTANEEPFRQADFIVNLAGANIGEKRLTEKRKAQVLNSRLDATRLIGKMLERDHHVKAVVQASAFGYYGDGKGNVLTEDAPPGNDFLADVCVQWEAAADDLRKLAPRVAVFRFAHVLSVDEGLLPRLMQPLKFGVMPVFGSGEQHIPWIHEEDLARMILFALENENVNDTYNAVSPSRSTLNELLQATADAMKRKPIKFHLPETLIKLGVGELGESFYYDVALSSEKIEREGFEFIIPNDLRSAIASL